MNKESLTLTLAQALEQSVYQAVMEHAPWPMVEVEGPAHVVHSMNEAFCELLNLQREDLLGKPLAEHIPDDTQCLALLGRVLDTGLAEAHVEAEGDSSKPVFWSYTCWPLQAGDTRRVGLMIQVTETAAFHKQYKAVNEALLISSLHQHELTEGAERRNLQLHVKIEESDRAEAILKESERQLRTLADSIPHLVWMAQPGGAIFWYNQRWYDYTGSTLEQAHGWGWKSLLDPDESNNILAKITAAFNRGEAWEDTFQLRRHDGEMRWHLSRMQPVCDENGAVVRWFGTNTDITDERRMEQDLRDHGLALSEADRRKSEFLATLAHELRNPLAPLRSGLEVLALATDDQATWDKAYGMMKRQLDQMVRLIDELMDLSRITRGTIDLRKERLDLRIVLEQALETSRPLIEKEGHTIVLDLPDEPVTIEGDGMRLIQVFCNLLNNAAKYTDRRGAISVHVNTGRDEASVTVEDNGIGIAQDQLGRVFNMFAQVERTNDRVQGGLGIGLNIVKHLVEMHGGRIEVSSDGIDAGSRFTVYLPLAPLSIPEAIPSTRDAASTQVSPLRVLVVDDNEDAATMMAILLTKLGHEVRIANDGAQAIAVGEQLAPNVVLLDIGMPLMDGYTACRMMRRRPWGKTAFITALTGLGQDEDRRRSVEAGFDHHLVKPIASDALLLVLAAANAARI